MTTFYDGYSSSSSVSRFKRSESSGEYIYHRVQIPPLPPLSPLSRIKVINENIKDTLDSTLDALHSICPLKANKNSIRESLRFVLDRDQSFREKTTANIKVHGWLSPTAKENPPPVEEFSFSVNEQGAIVETFYTLIEVELYTFLYDHAGIIPAKIVETFSKKQRPKVKTDFEMLIPS
ncbi:14819_t:CDS:2, partial [Funneliformis caledonium]